MNLPTKITLVRVILIPVFIALFLIDFPCHYFVATGVFILASVSDFLDGYLARKLKLVTDLGKFLDPLADKALVCSALILCCFISNDWMNLTVLIATIIIIIRELMITAFRTIAVSKNVVLAADIWGKIKTTTQMIGLSMYIAFPSAFDVNQAFGNVLMYGGFAMLLVSALFTVISGVNYLVANRSVFSSKEDSFAMAKEVIVRLDGTLAVAESFTGGAITAELVKVPGASNKLVKGIVCYSVDSKISDVGVDKDVIKEFGAVSYETAECMASSLVVNSGCDYAVATTGNAGPTAEKEGEVGVCYVAVASKDQTVVEKYQFGGDRAAVINAGKKQALRLLLKTISK